MSRSNLRSTIQCMLACMLFLLLLALPAQARAAEGEKAPADAGALAFVAGRIGSACGVVGGYVADGETLEDRQVRSHINSLTLEQKVAQLFVVTPESIVDIGIATAAGDATREAILATPVGGIIYMGQNLVDPTQTREMLANTMQYSLEACDLPIFLCVDEEGGTVARVANSEGFGVENVGDMCDVGATGDEQVAHDTAFTIGSYLADLGFNVDFAPVADIANVEGSSMDLRSFGSTAEAVSPMVAAQVRGFADAGVLSCAKHFPGIGGALGDSHESSINIEDSLQDLLAEELLPFQAAIDQGVPFIMVGHLSTPGVSGNDTPASINPDIVDGILRSQLGYDGIVITDSMGMGALTSACTPDRVGVAALLAGCDMILMPSDFAAAYQGVLDAVASGEISEERIDESLERIIRAKLGIAG